jgi:hypothetical protein
LGTSTLEVLMSVGSRFRRTSVVAVTFVALGTLAACGDDDDDSSADTTPAPTTTSAEDALCADREQLTTAMQGLTELDIVASGTDGLQAAVTEVKDSLSALKESASDSFQPQVEAVESSIQGLETAISDGSVSGIASAAADVASTGGTLLQSLGSLDCG